MRAFLILALLALTASSSAFGAKRKKHPPTQDSTPALQANSTEGQLKAKISVDGVRYLSGEHEVDVLLIPSGAQFVKKLSVPLEIDADINLFDQKDKIGSFYAATDADGDITIDHVPVGKYRLILLSHELIQVPSARKLAHDILSNYFTDTSTERLSNLDTDEVDIEIQPGTETKTAYHFTRIR
jgi:hypothetical protein